MFVNLVFLLLCASSHAFNKGYKLISSHHCSAHSNSMQLQLRDSKNELLGLGEKLTTSQPYSLLESAVVITLLAGLDGGFSGDWSKFGYISSSDELVIQNAMQSVGLFHILVCLPTVVFFTKQRNQPIAPAVLRTLLIGGLSAIKVAFAFKDENAIRFPKLDIVNQLSVLSQQGLFARLKQSLADKAAGSYDTIAVNQQIDSYIADNSCVMFSFSSCPYCLKAKNILIDQLGATVKVVELDVDKSVGYPLRAELGRRTGRTSVPSIWIGGKFIGGCNDGPVAVTGDGIQQSKAGGLVALLESGDLKPLLESSGALPIPKRAEKGIDVVQSVRPFAFFALPVVLYAISSYYATQH